VQIEHCASKSAGNAKNNMSNVNNIQLPLVITITISGTKIQTISKQGSVKFRSIATHNKKRNPVKDPFYIKN
jgi:hypothetical protein